MDPNRHVGDGRLTFGDNVKMRDTELTRALGIAGNHAPGSTLRFDYVRDGDGHWHLIGLD